MFKVEELEVWQGLMAGPYKPSQAELDLFKSAVATAAGLEVVDLQHYGQEALYAKIDAAWGVVSADAMGVSVETQAAA